MGETSVVSAIITSITGALTEFSTTNLGSVLVAALGIAVPLVLGWFAFRFIYRKAKKALTKGA